MTKDGLGGRALRVMGRAAFAVLALAAAGTARAAAGPDITLQGMVGFESLHHYIEVPFTVPKGAGRVTVLFAQDGVARHTVIDMGVRDPVRFRGWSGGARSSFTLAPTDASPGYLPGLIPAGAWHLLLGVPNIRPGVTTHYTAKIYFGRGPFASTFSEKPLRPGPAWFRGDLHAHTAHSDGKCLNRSATAKVPCPAFLTLDAADRRGLDFIAVTDHNTTSQYDVLRELQPYFDRTLVIPGRELTTFEGHANIFGTVDFVDFRLDGRHVRSADQLIAEAHKAGALFSVNHASSPDGEICMGCGWIAAVRDPGAIDAVEIVNGGALHESGRADGVGSGFAFWQSLLDRGFHPTAVAGSDNHDGTIALDRAGSIGWPATVVYAADLSEKAILAGIKAGHVYIDVDGGRDRRLEFTADGPHGPAMMGDRLTAAPGETVHIHLHVTGVAGGRVELVHDGALHMAPLAPDALKADDSRTFGITADGSRHWLYVEIRDAAGRLALVGNPLYLAPG